VIIAVAFYVVQWNAGIWVKLSVVTLSSCVVPLALSEVIRRIKPLRILFGMKPRRRVACTRRQTREWWFRARQSYMRLALEYG